MDIFRGLNGTIVLREDCVQILREGRIDRTFHAQEKVEIPYSEIKEVHYKAGSMINGYLSIVRTGTKKPVGIIKAMKDDASVVFRMFKNREAKETAVEIRRRQQKFQQ